MNFLLDIVFTTDALHIDLPRIQRSQYTGRISKDTFVQFGYRAQFGLISGLLFAAPKGAMPRGTAPCNTTQPTFLWINQSEERRGLGWIHSNVRAADAAVGHIRPVRAQAGREAVGLHLQTPTLTRRPREA